MSADPSAIRNQTGQAPRPAIPGRFVPGQSGNPNGRPSMPPEIREALRTLHAPKSIDFLAKLVTAPPKGTSTSDRIRAAETLIDRAWGRAPAAPGESLADLAEALVLRFRRPDDEDQPRDVTATASEVP